MKILILGAGKMGSFFCDLLSFDHDVAILDPDRDRLKFTFNVQRFMDKTEVEAFNPDLVLNAATVKYTKHAFEAIMPYISKRTILSDIASVKYGLKEFYASTGHRFMSTHPMFGPTFASLSNLRNENAIIISEGDEEGKRFFRDLYSKLELNITDCSFEEHDEMTAYSLSMPFASTFLFTSAITPQSAPGTTFKRHLDISRGLLSEDDYLLTEIMFNPHSPARLAGLKKQLERLINIVENRDADAMKELLTEMRATLSAQCRNGDNT